MTPFATVWVALFGFPLIATVFYARWTLPFATAATVVCGYLLLPERVMIDPPLLPPIDKNTVPAFSALVLIWLASRNPQRAENMLPGWLPRDRIARLLIAILFIGAFGTALTNTTPIIKPGDNLPALKLYDGFSMALAVLTTLIPFLLARKVMATPDGQKTLAVFIVGAAVVYAFLALWEVRMSPQLNNHVYGFFPHSWIQHKRGGGWRPIVFLKHGLLVGIFFATAIIITFGLFKSGAAGKRAKFLAAGIWLLITIVLCKVLGALALTLLFLPVLLLTPQRVQIIVAFSFGMIVLMYPVLRNADLIPTDTVIGWAELVDTERAASLEFRIVHEDMLLVKAARKPLFGWGGNARSRVFNERGEDISVTDGYWLILFGQGGWARYIGEFGLLLLGIFRLMFLPRDRIDPITVTLAFALVVNLIDLLPNAGLTPVTWLLTGALVGRSELRDSLGLATVTASAPSARPSVRYARDFGGSGPKQVGMHGYHGAAGREPAKPRPTAPRARGRNHG